MHKKKLIESMKLLTFFFFLCLQCSGQILGIQTTASATAPTVFDDTSSYTSHTILNSEVSDNGYQCENCGTIYAPYYSTLSRLVFTTKARFIKVKCYSNNMGLGAGDGVLGVTVDGVTDSVHFPVNDVYKTIDLGKEDILKTVQIVNGTAIIFFGSTVAGSYFTGLEFPTNRTISITTTTGPVLLFGNSIIAGFGTPEPVIYGVMTVLRNVYGRDVAQEGFSAQALYYLTNTQTKFEEFITRTVRYGASKYYYELGTNDCYLVDAGLQTVSQYQSMLARVLDTLHALVPTKTFIIQSPLYRGNEASPNGNGEYLAQYRVADSTVCLTRSWTRYVNALGFLVATDLLESPPNGLHPTQPGAAKYAQKIDSILTLY